MNNKARYGFPSFALALAGIAVLGGCKLDWARKDEAYLGHRYRSEATLATERTISSIRPGQTRLEDVERSIGALERPPEEFAALVEVDGSLFRTWDGRGRNWQFHFSKDGLLESFSRTGRLFSMEFKDSASAESFHQWYEDRLAFKPVPPERALGFKPGATTQEHVITEWGPCKGAAAIAGEGFSMRWGSNLDNWTLQFDASGTLVAAPVHYRSDIGG